MALNQRVKIGLEMIRGQLIRRGIKESGDAPNRAAIDINCRGGLALAA
jgi:hypothetical protein